MTKFSSINLTLLLSVALILAGIGLINCRMFDAGNQIGQPENKEEIHADTESPEKETTPEEQRVIQPTPVPTAPEVGQSTITSPTPITKVPPGYSSERIQVKFQEGIDVDPPVDALPPSLTDLVDSITPLFRLPGSELERLGADRLKLWFTIRLKPTTDPVAFIQELQSLENVENAQFAPLPAPPP